MKVSRIVILAIVTLATAFAGGCSVKEPTCTDPSKGVPYIHSHKATRGEHGRVEVNGVIHNPASVAIEIFGYVDFYQNGVKVDSGLFSCTPDARGKATFQSASYKVNSGKYEYKIRMTNVFVA